MHHDKTTTGDDHKPAIILHYNSKKGGVDNMDKLAATYSCKRKSSRWPLSLFFNIVDVSCIAALIIWLCNSPEGASRSRSRRCRLFMLQLDRELVQEQNAVRSANPRALQGEVRSSIKRANIQGVQTAVEGNQRSKAPPRKRRCHICPRSADRKVKQECAVCSRNVCMEHATPGVMC